ncbi:MAG TPA: nuclear transport factor 2 family protein [Candidatus Limnocylindrales bacterium]|nr:nuclear transport factor 2 family protein [Candidatus Limnocylindrales bacterium]
MHPAPRHLTTSALVLSCLLLTLSRLAAASPEDGALAADHSLTAAINKADQSSVEKLLDPEFSWTDRTGKTRSKSEILPALASLASESDADVKIIDAGHVVLIHGNHRIPSQNASVRFLRVWVKRSEAWQLLVYQETTKADKNPEKRSGFGAPSNGMAVACENPCKTVPYKPDTAAEREVVSMWQAVERTVLTNDVEAWTPNFTDDFIFVTPDGGAPLNKANRVAMITELRRANTTLIPAEVTSMKVWVLGDAAVMRSEHKPLHGKLLHVTRLFEKHNNHWQIAFGQQTWVE